MVKVDRCEKQVERCCGVRQACVLYLGETLPVNMIHHDDLIVIAGVRTTRTEDMRERESVCVKHNYCNKHTQA